MNEAIHAAQNRPLWRMMSTFGAIRTHSGACQKWPNKSYHIHIQYYYDYY